MSKARRRGFSLVELLVTIVIGAIIALSILAILMAQIQITSTQNRNMLNQDSLRATMEYMAEDIRLIGSLGSEGYVVAADTTSFQFVANLDGDDVPDLAHYYLSSQNLYRDVYIVNGDGTIGALVTSDTLLSNATELVFEYYQFNVNDTPLTAPVAEDELGLITSVEIKMTIDETADDTAFTTGKVAPQTMNHRVTIRNRLGG